MDDREQLEKIRKILECGLCLESFDDPRSLPCQHTFCRKCLIALSQRNSRRTLKCPYCRKESNIPKGGPDGYERNITIVSIQDVLQAQRGTEDCEEQETCTDAGDYSSPRSRAGHPEMVDHMECVQHPLTDVDQWCNECGKPICEECIDEGRHKKHHVVDLETGCVDLSKKCIEKLPLLKVKLERTTQHLELLTTVSDKTRASMFQARSMVRMQSERLHEEIQILTEQLLRRINDEFTENTRPILKQVGETRELRQKLDRCVINIDEVCMQQRSGKSFQDIARVLREAETLCKVKELDLTGGDRVMWGFEDGAIYRAECQRMLGELMTTWIDHMGVTLRSSQGSKNLPQNRHKRHNQSSQTDLHNADNLVDNRYNRNNQYPSAMGTTLTASNNNENLPTLAHINTLEVRGTNLVAVSREGNILTTCINTVTVHSKDGEHISDIGQTGSGKIIGVGDVTVLPDRNIAISDQRAKNIKVFQPNRVFAYILGGGQETPLGITVLKNGFFAACFPNDGCVMIYDGYHSSSVVRTVIREFQLPPTEHHSKGTGSPGCIRRSTNQYKGNVNTNAGNVNINVGNSNPNTVNSNPNARNATTNAVNFNPNAGNENVSEDSSNTIAENANPNVENMYPNSEDANPNARYSNLNAGNANINSGNASSNTGNASSNTGNASSNTGNASSNAGNASSNTGNASSNAGNASSNTGNASSNAGNASSNTGNASSNAGNASSNTGNASSNAGNAEPTGVLQGAYTESCGQRESTGMMSCAPSAKTRLLRPCYVTHFLKDGLIISDEEANAVFALRPKPRGVGVGRGKRVTPGGHVVSGDRLGSSVHGAGVDSYGAGVDGNSANIHGGAGKSASVYGACMYGDGAGVDSYGAGVEGNSANIHGGAGKSASVYGACMYGAGAGAGGGGDYECIWAYCPAGGGRVRGVATDHQDRVLLTVSDQRVLLLSKHGQLLQELLTAEHGLENPVSVAVKDSVLAIGQANHTVSIYHYL